MASLTELLFHPVSNAIMTVLTGVTALYWLFTFITGDLFGDADVSAQPDVDSDVDTEGDDTTMDKSILQKTLEFVNVGRVPFMVVLTVFKLIAWVITLTSSVVLGAASWGWGSVVLLVPVALIAYVVTRYVTMPLIKVYDAMSYNGEEPQELLGRVARMRSTISGDTIGAAEVKIQSDVIRINVKSKTGESISYDAEVMISAESNDKKFYLVIPEITLSNIV